MAQRLGDLLLRDGIITSAQLDEALKYQVIFGGKLGTNLIEMGVLEEEEVARALSKLFGVPTVPIDEIMAVEETAIASLSREIAEKFEVCPLKRDGRRLTLLMADPSDFKVLEDLSFRTGLIIKPVVAAEIRLIFALEKYYGINRDRRYIHVTKKIAARRPASVPGQASAPAAVAVPAPLPVAAPAPTAVAPAAPPPAPAAVVAPLSPAASPAPADELIELEPIEELTPLAEIADSETLALYLADARDRDDVLDSIALYLGHQFARVAVFLVRGEIAHGWKASADHQDLPDFHLAQIPLDEASVLKTVAETRAFFLGPIPRSPYNSMFLQEIGGRVPETALLVPLLMMGRVVGIIYVDGKGEELSERLFELQKLTAKAAMAFEILVLKNKIVSL